MAFLCGRPGSSELYETADSLCRLVRSVGVVLAAGLGGLAFNAANLAGLAAVPAAGHLSWRRFCAVTDAFLFAGAAAGLSAACMSLLAAVTERFSSCGTSPALQRPALPAERCPDSEIRIKCQIHFSALSRRIR